MTNESKKLLEETLIAMNLGDVHTFARKQLILLLEGRINNWQNEIKIYFEKYKMPWKEANAKFHDLTQFDMIEKEDDLMQWEDAEDFLCSYIKTLNEIKNA